MIVLDADVVSAPLKSIPEQRVVRWLDAQDPDDVVITVVTVAELLFGVARLAAGLRRTQLARAVETILTEEFQDRIEVFDLRAAREYADIVSTREHGGAPIRALDAQIAAISRVRSATVATRNVRHFEGIGIDLINPWEYVG
jgi:toxin FitB